MPLNIVSTASQPTVPKLWASLEGRNYEEKLSAKLLEPVSHFVFQLPHRFRCVQSVAQRTTSGTDESKLNMKSNT